MDPAEPQDNCTSSLCQAVDAFSDNTTLLDVTQAISNPLEILLILIAAWIAIRIGRMFIRRTVAELQADLVQKKLAGLRRRTPRVLQNTSETSSLRRAQRAETIGALLRSVVTLIISVIAILAILKILGINLGPVVAGAGIATAALGFGAQNIVRDFLAGFFIVLEDQYGVGDVVDVGGAAGLVESVGLRITRLRAADGTLWHVPNGEIKSVANQSQQWARAIMDFRLDVGIDIERAKQVIQETADEMWRDTDYEGIILEEPAVWGPEEVGPYGVLLKLAVKCKPLEQWSLSRTLRTRVKVALDAANIAIAPLPISPQQQAPAK